MPSHLHEGLKSEWIYQIGSDQLPPPPSWTAGAASRPGQLHYGRAVRMAPPLTVMVTPHTTSRQGATHRPTTTAPRRTHAVGRGHSPQSPAAARCNPQVRSIAGRTLPPSVETPQMHKLTRLWAGSFPLPHDQKDRNR